MTTDGHTAAQVLELLTSAEGQAAAAGHGELLTETDEQHEQYEEYEEYEAFEPMDSPQTVSSPSTDSAASPPFEVLAPPTDGEPEGADADAAPDTSRHSRGSLRASSRASSPASSVMTPEAKLRKLQKLRDEGLIDQIDYDKKKSSILSEM